MTRTHRNAPDPEWVQMYRSGVSSSKIAAGAGVPGSTVRYHMAVAAREDPGLRDAHRAAISVPSTRLTSRGVKNLEDVLAFYTGHGRVPAKSRTDRERALATWLARRRTEAADGTLSPAYAALDTIPGWREQPTKQEVDQARWKQRLGEVAAYLNAGNEWPRHNKTDDREERVLGVWLHTQRIDHRAGKLTAAKEKQLNEIIPGWRQGRPRRGANSRRSEAR